MANEVLPEVKQAEAAEAAKREEARKALAQQLAVRMWRRSPETGCSLGPCFRQRPIYSLRTSLYRTAYCLSEAAFAASCCRTLSEATL